MKKIIITYVYVLSGFILFSIYIYIYFIRKRLPKDFPFILTEFRFWILIYICGIYIYIIKQHIYPKVPNEHLQKVITLFINKPYVYLDSFIKHNRIIFPYYHKIFCEVVDELDFINIKDFRMLMYFLQIIPRLFLLLIFIVDIFWVGKLEIFYYFIFLGLIPLIPRYIKYSLEYALEQYTLYLENLYRNVWIIQKPNYDDDDDIYEAPYHNRTVSIREYIKIQVQTEYDAENDIEYIATPHAKQEYSEKYKHLHKEETLKQYFDVLQDEFHTLIGYLIIIDHFLTYYNALEKASKMTKIQLFIYICYFLAWLYILIISFHTVPNFDYSLQILKILLNYYPQIDPFSEIHLYQKVPPL